MRQNFRSFARLERARGNFESALKWAKKALEMDNIGVEIKNEAKEMENLIQELEEELT